MEYQRRGGIQSHWQQKYQCRQAILGIHDYLQNLEHRIVENEINDKELKAKVESLNRLYTKIELIESKQISQNDAMNTTLTSLNISIQTLNKKLDVFIDGYNRLNTDVEVLKSKS